MPTDFRISDLPTSIPFNNLDLMEVSQVDSQSPSGYSSVKKTMEEIGEKLLNDIQYSSALATTNKKIIPAINEVNSNIPKNSDFSLSGLSDTTINNPTSGQILQYSSNKWQNKPFTLANLTDTTISSAINGQILKYNGSKWINASITSEDKTSDITFNETVTGNTKAYLKNDVVYFSYQGESKTHSANDVIAVLPTALRPASTIFIPFAVNALTYGVIFIYANGNVSINQIGDSTATGRIYFSVAYPIA